MFSVLPQVQNILNDIKSSLHWPYIRKFCNKMKVSIEDISKKQPKQFFNHYIANVRLSMFDYFEAHLHSLDIRYRTCQIDFFKKLQNKNILFLRHHIHDLVPFISWSRGTRHSFGFSRQEAERICPKFPIFHF